MFIMKNHMLKCHGISAKQIPSTTKTKSSNSLTKLTKKAVKKEVVEVVREPEKPETSEVGTQTEAAVVRNDDVPAPPVEEDKEQSEDDKPASSREECSRPASELDQAEENGAIDATVEMHELASCK